MSTYELNSSNGPLQLAPKTALDYKGLKLLGRASIDWNEPLQQNAVILADKMEDLTTIVENQATYSSFETAFNAAKND